MEHYKKLERMYLSANLNQEIYKTTTVKIEDEKAQIQLTVEPKYFHALGAAHGSVYFKLLDDAAFFAVNSIVKDVFVLTTNFNINLIKPVSKGVITAIGKVKFKSKNLRFLKKFIFIFLTVNKDKIAEWIALVAETHNSGPVALFEAKRF